MPLIWNLLTLAIVLAVLAVWRFMDRNNRSIEVVKRYAEHLKKELESHAEDRREDLKAYMIDLDVNQKAAREVLKRVQTVETALNERAEAIGNIADRIAEYDRALAELKNMSIKVDENLRVIHGESDFLDSLARTLKSSKLEVETLKKAIPEIRESVEDDAKAMVEELREYFVKEIKSGLDEAMDTVDALRLKSDDSVEAVGSMHAAAAQAAEERYKQIASQLTEAFKRAREEGEKLEDASFQKLKAQIDERSQKLGDALEKRFDNIRDAARERVAETQGMIKSLKAEWKKDALEAVNTINETAKTRAAEMEARLASTEELAARSEAMYSDRFAQIEIKAADTANALFERIKNTIRTQEEELAGRQNELGKAVKDGMAEMTAMAQKTELDYMTRLSSLENEVKTREKKLDNELKTLEEKALSGFGERTRELRDVTEKGLSRLEGLRLDADRMEKALRDTMASVEIRVGEDFALFGKDLAARQAQFEDDFKNESARIRASVEDLEKDLNSLKTRAYSNVSEKLKIFEDDFFADLRKRSDESSEKFAQWRVDMEEQLANTMRLATESFSQAEKEWLEEQRNSLSLNQGRMHEQLDKLGKQLDAYRHAINERTNEADDALKELKTVIRADLDDARAAADAYLNAELERWKQESRERLESAEKAASEDTRELELLVSKTRDELGITVKALLDESRNWQQEFAGTYTKAESEQLQAIEKLGKSFKAETAEIISNWEKEKKNILDKASAERDVIAKDVKILSQAVSESLDELGKRSLQYMEELGKSHSSYSTDISRRAEESLAGINNSIQEYRTEIKTARDSLEVSLLGIKTDFNEEKKNNELAFQEMSKELKAFQKETKLFERADELKNSLSASLEAMKTEIARIESRRGEMAELETQYSRIKRLEDETGQKIARFLAEKRRIDTLEDDFKRLLSLSQGVDQKLAQITESNDQLTQISAEVRRLAEAADEAAEKYDRIEKKANILDTTADAVDKNFHDINELEKGFISLDAEIREMPDRIIQLKRSMEEILSARPGMDAAIERFNELEHAMNDAERRITELNKAREWLARAETRFEELNQKTQEQLRFLKDILKEEPGSKRKEKGAPSLSVQETVRKLSHEGWTVEEIARTVKLSRGEVELILELGGKD